MTALHYQAAITLFMLLISMYAMTQCVQEIYDRKVQVVEVRQ
jgi:hypothetical protein